MKRLTLKVENAVAYHEPDTRRPSRVLNSTPETDPVPTPTETSIPDIDEDYVFLQVIDDSGRVLLQLPIRNYYQIIGRIDEEIVSDETRNVRPQTHKALRDLCNAPTIGEPLPENEYLNETE